jgi:hypothetical protein
LDEPTQGKIHFSAGAFLTRTRADAYHPASMAHKLLAA